MFATIEEAPPKAKIRRFTRSEYYAMGDMGFFEGQHVELIEGEIVVMAPQKPPHFYSLDDIGDSLRDAFGSGFCVRKQAPLSLPGDSDPEPDVAVVKGKKTDFLGKHPTHAELVVEVSLTSYAYDRNRKSAIYARAGIPEYWIVNLLKRQLEVLREPKKQSAKSFVYSSCRVLFPGDFVSPLALPKAKISVAALFPPVQS